MRFWDSKAPTWAGLLLGLLSYTAKGKIINVTTNDNYAKIESAVAGDEVVIAPGTYAFRVYLTGQGSVTNPIVIRAQDPKNPPVWDFGSTLVENAPGSYTAGDRGRGGWQFSGASSYSISGIVFRHCRWLQTNAAAGPLMSSIRSAVPGFRNAAAKDFTLVNGSACIGAASASVSAIPGEEYFQGEITKRLWRIRDSALDLGAFESTSTTNLSFGPYDPFPSPPLYIRRTGTSALVSWPLYAQDFQLLGSSLTMPWAWSLVSGTSATNLTAVSSSMAVDAAGRLFRLRR